MAEIAAEVLIRRLADWGVDTVFGQPGDAWRRPRCGRATDARQGHLRTGEVLHESFPVRPASEGNYRHDFVQRQDPGASVLNTHGAEAVGSSGSR